MAANDIDLALVVEDLQKVFRSKGETVTAVDGVSFDVPTGAFFTLLGSSGCGKTTTLRCVAGLEQPTAGKIVLGGETVFKANCAGCHRVNTAGGRIGPDLSRIGSARTREVMSARIRRGSEAFRAGFEPVTITPPDGKPIQGVKKNEDLFSVQIMDTAERIQGYEKDKMKSVENGKKSAMPIFGPERLSDSDLDDLLRYLQTLRGFNPAVKQ